MSFKLGQLLASTKPLTDEERQALEDWLQVLEGDVKTFGETPEDTARMNRIRRRLAEPWVKR